MSNDIFSKGCLVKVSVSQWGARTKIPSKALVADSGVDLSYVGASKRLVDARALRDLTSLVTEAKSWLFAQSLPFPLDGVVFVPTDSIEKVNAKLEVFQKLYEELADNFAAEYPQLREAARASLGTLYAESDYPATVRDRFSFSWQFLSLAPGDEKLLSPALVAQERAKFQQLIAEATEAAVSELRVRFATVVDHMVERLTGEEDGKAKVFRDSLVGNLKTFLDSFETLNVADDAAMAALVKNARKAIEGVDAPDLRKDDGLRGRVAERMAEVQKALDGMMVPRPTRKVRVAKKDASTSESTSTNEENAA